MKYVIMSFDDGRLDTYSNAFQIIKKYNLTATINVVSDFVLNQDRYTVFKSAGNRAMTIEQLLECEKNGIEIACHGSTHQNTEKDLLKNISELIRMGIRTNCIGFASPQSELTEYNYMDIKKLKDKGIIKYIRSGVQIRREGFLYMVLSWIERKTHSKILYYTLNKNNITTHNKTGILRSAAITKYTTVEQIKYFINRMKDNESIIFMFHSILDNDSPYRNEDEWYWDKSRFETFCNFLYESNNLIKTITTMQLVDGLC